MLILDWIFLWVHGSGGGGCRCGDRSLMVVDGSLTVVDGFGYGLFVGLARFQV